MKIGFIGCGNMASALIAGILAKGIAGPSEIIASALHEETLQKAHERFGICTTLDNRETARADLVVLAIKPQFYEAVIRGIAQVVTPAQTVISLAPGLSIARIQEWFGFQVPLIRANPNTPAMVGAGLTAMCASDTAGEHEKEKAAALFEACGTAEWMTEHLVDASVAVSGSSPAYIFMVIEAMADGAVREGFPRSQAYRMAAQAVLGSARLVLETGMHPAVLKDMVCSPAGTTIEAVAAMEKSGLRSAILEGMSACSEKVRAMGKK